MPPICENILDHMLSRTIPNDNGCLIWQGCLNRGGYGLITHKQKKYQVHRLVYMEAWGAIPDNYDIDHLCYDTACIEPFHLEAVTKRENMRRRAKRNRLLRSVNA